MRKYRILSIDWDYFINATLEERFLLFPDGGNEHIIGPMSNFVWSSRYADSSRNCKNNKEIKDIMRGV